MIESCSKPNIYKPQKNIVYKLICMVSVQWGIYLLFI